LLEENGLTENEDEQTVDEHTEQTGGESQPLLSTSIESIRSLKGSTSKSSPCKPSQHFSKSISSPSSLKGLRRRRTSETSDVIQISQMQLEVEEVFFLPFFVFKIIIF
jgi:hypothetical protein